MRKRPVTYHTGMICRIASFFICLCLSAVSAADEIRGAFGLELSTNISNYEGFRLFATSDDEVDGMDGEKWRLYQMMEPLRRYYHVEFEDVPGSFPIIDEGIVSAYEGWIATIIGKSDKFDSYGECQDQHDKFAQVLRDRYGEPLAFKQPSWYSQNKRFPRYKHRLVMGYSNIWESGNTILLTTCNQLKDDEMQFSLIYESALWQKVVAGWRSLMEEQRELEKEKSRPKF